MLCQITRVTYLIIFICVLTTCISNTPEIKKEFTIKEQVLPYEVAYGDNGEMLFVDWQPSVKRIVFPSEVNEWPRRRLYSCNSNGKYYKELASTTEPCFLECALSPDGKKLLFVASGITRGYSHDITLLDLDTNEEIRLTPRYKVDTQGKEVPIETQGEIYYEVDSYAGGWSPKGNYIIYQVKYEGDSIKYAEEFYRIIDSDTKKEVKIFKNTTYPRFSPDDRYIIYSIPDRTDPKDENYKWYKIIREELLTKQKIELKREPRSNFPDSFSWSPDGKLIAFIQKTDIGYQICTMKPDGSNFTITTKFPTESISGIPSWSPDSKKITFISQKQIFIVEINTKNLYQLTKGSDYQQVYFVNNDRLLALRLQTELVESQDSSVKLSRAFGQLVLIDIIEPILNSPLEKK